MTRAERALPTTRNIAVFMGTRPEAVKLAPVVAALRGANDFRCTVVATGQHKEMFRQVAETFSFAVDADLDVMRPNQTLAGLTARLMDGIDGWLGSAQPDMALVQGDTTSALVASLACFYRRIPIGHVEAGLRTGNIWSPFPEEVNRRLATPLVALHIAPTEAARAALLREAVPEETVSVTGNTVIDALRIEGATQANDAALRARIDEELSLLVGADWAQVPMWSSSPGHLRPKKVVETGVAHGVTSRFILEALKRSGDGYLWSIDLLPLERVWRKQVGAAVGDRCSNR